MVDLFIRLVDKIIELARVRDQRSDRVFVEIVEPLFKDLPVVVQDYLVLFREAEGALARSSADDASTATVVTELISRRREEALLLRRKVAEMATSIRRSFDDADLIEYARAIEGCFYSIDAIPDATRASTDATTLIGLLDLLKTAKLDKVTLYDAIRRARHALEHSWTNVTQRYAVLRLRYALKRDLHQ